MTHVFDSVHLLPCFVVLLPSLWVRVDFTMKTPFSGFPTKAMFLPSYESSIVCQESGEQTMAGSDEGKNAGKTAGLSCYLKRNPSLVNFHSSDFSPEHFPKIHPQTLQKNLFCWVCCLPMNLKANTHNSNLSRFVAHYVQMHSG